VRHRILNPFRQVQFLCAPPIRPGAESGYRPVCKTAKGGSTPPRDSNDKIDAFFAQSNSALVDQLDGQRSYKAALCWFESTRVRPGMESQSGECPAPVANRMVAKTMGIGTSALRHSQCVLGPLVGHCASNADKQVRFL
jgi:hypothetical protein